MAMIRKRGKRYQAVVRKGDVSTSATFEGKAQAVAWATEIEARALATKRGQIPPGLTFGQLLARYRDEVTPTHEGAKWETDRINMILREDPIAQVKLTDFHEPDVAAWRDRRLKKVQGSSVRREWAILSAAADRAKREWHWLNSNPFKDVDRPPANQPRNRRPSQGEIERILMALGCDPQVTPVTATARAGFAWLFAIEVGMRAGEIVGLRWSDIHGNVARLPKTKNGRERNVPLTVEAVRLLNFLPRVESDDRVFQIDSRSLDTLWRKGRDRALVKGLHFHDSRREALTRLSKKLPVMELAAVSGHLDLRILMKTYYAPDAADIATRMG